MFESRDVKVYQSLKCTSPPLMEGRRLKSVYIMSAQEAYVNKTRKNKTMDLWHARPRHVSHNRIKAMMKKSMLKGLPNLEVCDNIIYVGCQYGKVHELPYE